MPAFSENYSSQDWKLVTNDGGNSTNKLRLAYVNKLGEIKFIDVEFDFIDFKTAVTIKLEDDKKAEEQVKDKSATERESKEEQAKKPPEFSFTTLKDPQAFITALKANLKKLLGASDADNLNLDKMPFGITGFNNWLVRKVKILGNDGVVTEKTLIFGENPSLTTPLGENTVETLRELYKNNGMDSNVIKELIETIQKKKHYLLHAFEVFKQYPTLLIQLLELAPGEKILSIEDGDFQGWVLNELFQTPFAFTEPNSRSLGVPTADLELAKQILLDCFSMNANILSSEQLQTLGVLNKNDLNAETLMLKGIFENPTIYISFDSVIKIQFFMQRLSGTVPETESIQHIDQRQGGAIGYIIKDLIDPQYLVGSSFFDGVAFFLEAQIQAGISVPKNVTYYPCENDENDENGGGGVVCVEDGEEKKIMTVNQYLAKIGESDRQEKNELILALIFGILFATKQKLEVILKNNPAKIDQLVLGGGLMGKQKSWRILGEAIFRSLGISLKNLAKFDGAHQALAYLLADKIAKREFEGVDLSDPDFLIFAHTIAQHLTEFLPEIVDAQSIMELNGEQISFDDGEIQAYESAYQAWKALQTKVTNINQFGQLTRQKNEPQPLVPDPAGAV